MVRRSYIFSGRVQGVGFRMTARGVAGRYAVTGWVRNEPDGTVRLEAQGDAAEIERFIDDLKREMSGNITGVSANEIAVMGTEREFVIAR